jgi:hypothetical protein
VPLVDEIVDTFHAYDKEELITEFEDEYYKAQKRYQFKLILNSFQQNGYNTTLAMILFKHFTKHETRFNQI